MINHAFKKIPEKYMKEFHAQQTTLIKSRVHLFCALAVAIYFVVSIIGGFINPNGFLKVEMFAGIALVICSTFVLYNNQKAQTLRLAKLNAYLFTALLLLILSKLSMAYAEIPLVTASIFVFTLFLVSITIPWIPLELIPIWFMHITAFTIIFLFVRNLPGSLGKAFTIRHCLDGILFQTMALWLCFVVRKQETIRDIENFVLFKEVEDKGEKMRKDLEWATRVHKTIIPDSIDTEKVEIAVSYKPAYYIGGDYVCFRRIEGDRLVFIISDATGHGVPSALIESRIHSEFGRLIKETHEPGEILKQLNDFMKTEFAGSDMYLSAFCGFLDIKKKKLCYSNYGHPSQYVYDAKDGITIELSSQASLLGIPIEEKNEMHQDEINVREGDRILLFTDGITETMDSRGEEYGGVRLKDFLEKNNGLTGKEFNENLLKRLDAFRSGPYEDDICVMTIKIKPQGHIFAMPKI